MRPRPRMTSGQLGRAGASSAALQGDRLPVYSHSRLSSFENCPLQYRYRYIDRIRSDFESIEAFVGKRAHEVLEGIYTDLDRARAEGPEAALARYEELWDRSFSPNVRVVRPDLDAAWYRKLGARCVANFWERNYPFRIDPAKIIGVEMKVEMSLDQAGRFRMMGYVDRAQHAEPGVIEIHDYKTTASLPKEGSLRYDRQLPLYEIAIRQRFPETKEVRLVWHFLAHGVEVVEKRRPEDLDRVRRSCIALIQTVERARDFASKKGPLCAWCDYQEICPEWKGTRPLAPPAFPNGVPKEPEIPWIPSRVKATEVRDPGIAGPPPAREGVPAPSAGQPSQADDEPAPQPEAQPPSKPQPAAEPAGTRSPRQLTLF